MSKPSLNQKNQVFHKDWVGCKISETFQIPSHHFHLPLNIPLKPPTPIRQTQEARSTGHLSSETTFLIA